jgi:integrase
LTSAAGKVWEPTKDRRIKKRGEFYWARFKKRGVTVQESLSTQSFDTAKRMVEEIESCILLGVDWRKERELFDTAWEEFMIDKAQGNKTKIAREKTLAEYAGFGERFYLPHFKTFRLQDVNDAAWEEFVEKIRKERSDMLFFNLRKYLMGFLSWAKRKGKIRELPQLFDPDAKVRAERETAGPGRAYTLEELQIMRARAAEIGGGFYLFVLMAQFMGMRPGEINQLKRDRVDLLTGVIALRKSDTKTHRARLVPIHPEVLPKLEFQMSWAKDSPYLFPNHRDRQRPMDKTGFKKRWAEVLEAANLSGRFYDFRHTFITHALRSGMNPVVVAEITGTSIKVIQKHYLHLSPGDLTAEIGKISLGSVVDKTCTFGGGQPKSE